MDEERIDRDPNKPEYDAPATDAPPDERVPAVQDVDLWLGEPRSVPADTDSSPDSFAGEGSTDEGDESPTIEDA